MKLRKRMNNELRAPATSYTVRVVEQEVRICKNTCPINKIKISILFSDFWIVAWF